jgi:hypothetical protein
MQNNVTGNEVVFGDYSSYTYNLQTGWDNLAFSNYVGGDSTGNISFIQSKDILNILFDVPQDANKYYWTDYFDNTSGQIIPTIASSDIANPYTGTGIVLEGSNTMNLQANKLEALAGQPINVNNYSTLNMSWKLGEKTDRKNDAPLLGSEFWIELTNNGFGVWTRYVTDDLKGEPGIGIKDYLTKPYFKNFYYEQPSDLAYLTETNKYREDPNSPYYNQYASNKYVGQFTNETLDLKELASSLWTDISGVTVTNIKFINHDPNAQLVVGGLEFYNTDIRPTTVFEPAEKHIMAKYGQMYSYINETLEQARDLALQSAKDYASGTEAFQWVNEQRTLDIYHKTRRYIVEAWVLFQYEDEMGIVTAEVAKATYIVPLSQSDMLATVSFDKFIETENLQVEETNSVFIYYDPIYQTARAPSNAGEYANKGISLEVLDATINTLESKLFAKGVATQRLSASQLAEMAYMSEGKLNNNVIFIFGPIPDTLLPSKKQDGTDIPLSEVYEKNLLRKLMVSGTKVIGAGQYSAWGMPFTITTLIDDGNDKYHVELTDQEYLK